MLPTAMEPEILLGMTANHALQHRGKALGQRRYGIGAVLVFFRVDNVGSLAFVAPVPAVGRFGGGRASACLDNQGHIVFQSEEGDGLVRGGRAAKKIHELSFLSRVLVTQ